ncbi:FumA C-terminus/TtdB family hydratase beta subunit [Youxingia wuxianensis]|uniref:Fumarate hydratase C-terminal domain-containing protein n=1 Tax=Youxingia wuxianensis TaxID=2763678 RepID=A0A926EQZ7_9FIRM|nr:FumA C-terminus/TtdB family hydratase beta subunit [Youxingia wuxianensis]MBC8584695.1 fumarate hydratase C-terminal domain-containing protein [Youxingia wuxianensis]
MKTYHINAQELAGEAQNLRVGDRVLLTGVIYTARDAAHKRIMQAIRECLPLPFDLNGAIIYFAGPTPAPQNMAIGSCGPTTSSRMNPYTPTLMDLGLCATIGKGERSKEVYDAIVRNKGVYLCSIGGAGALAAQCIKSCQVIAYEDLGCESVKKLYVEQFPLIVAADCTGENIFDKGKQQYKLI